MLYLNYMIIEKVKKKMSRYQWSYGNDWIGCNKKNNKTFAYRREHPSLEPLYLANDYGELWGSFENDTMKFRLHGDATEMNVRIRRAAVSNELPIYAMLTPQDDIHILSYEVCRQLFEDGQPREQETFANHGTERLKVHKNILYQWAGGEFRPRRYKRTDLTKRQVEDETSTRYKWHFKGPMLSEKVRIAVQTLCSELPEQDKAFLLESFEHFNPSEDDTEYGPYQFTDYLSTELNRSDISFKLIDAIAKVPSSEWTPFDSLTNGRIERARQQKRPVVFFHAHGEKYMILFDADQGDGQRAAVIHPSRYQKILESIEEQFHQSVSTEHEQQFGRLFDALTNTGIDPRLFVMALASSPETAIELVSNEVDRENIRSIINRLESSQSRNASTRVQQFMPALLQKFKECDIQMSNEETIRPKFLCPMVLETIENGMAIPASQQGHCTDFKSLIHFIHDHQSWKMPPGNHTCDICSASRKTTLSHCGTARACLKCWADSLVHTNMTCPFCRGVIGEKQLKKSAVAAKPKPAKKRSRKRKRRAYDTPEEILSEIHGDSKYTNITLASKEPMRKWFTILLRRKMVAISQMPFNDQGKKDFKEAMKAFKLLT